MVRKFVTMDGEILSEEEWRMKPIDRCFFCDTLLLFAGHDCEASLDGQHDWVSLVAS